jgi:hypothetical protein
VVASVPARTVPRTAAGTALIMTATPVGRTARLPGSRPTKGRATTMPSLLAEGTEAAHSLPMSPEAFGLLSIAGFALLLAITLAFRNVSNRH